MSIPLTKRPTRKNQSNVLMAWLKSIGLQTTGIEWQAVGDVEMANGEYQTAVKITPPKMVALDPPGKRQNGRDAIRLVSVTISAR